LTFYDLVLQPKLFCYVSVGYYLTSIPENVIIKQRIVSIHSSICLVHANTGIWQDSKSLMTIKRLCSFLIGPTTLL